MRIGLPRALLIMALLSGSHLASAARATAATDRVRRFELTGTVDPLIARAAQRAVEQAEAKGAALLVRIDTPGGLDSAMRRIVKAISNSKVPVTCWVGPSGARAASAGAFILLACPTAAMAPGTNVGAAHPVGFRGEVLGEKVTNDAAAFIRSLAERNNRNADWAESAVRQSASISAEEALRIDVIDRMAASEKDLFPGVTSFVATGLTPVESLLHNLIDPNLAFLFFLIGAGLIVFEVFSPGGFGAVIGAVFLAASTVMLGMLPVNLAGVFLLVAAMTLFAIEAQVPGVGFPTAGAVAFLVLGGLFLFDSSIPNARVSRPLIAGSAVSVAAFFGLVVQAAIRARKMPMPPHAPVIGAAGVVIAGIGSGGEGVVRAMGEQWGARSAGASLPEGTRVRVTAVDGLTVTVEESEETDGGQT